jgi:hypothetical protein
MKNALAFVHGGGLFPMELLALTGALFLFLYIKKENFNVWFSFAAVTIMALALLSMVCTVIGACCMHHHRAKHRMEWQGGHHRFHRGGEEGRMEERGMHWGGPMMQREHEEGGNDGEEH